MADTDTQASSSSVASTHAGRKRSSARRRPARKKTSPRKKASARRRGRAGSLESLLAGLSRQAARAGSRIAALSAEGVSSARRTLGKAGVASKKTIDRMTREWKQMDTAKRAQFVAALLGALAAASAPIVRSRLKKR